MEKDTKHEKLVDELSVNKENTDSFKENQEAKDDNEHENNKNDDIEKQKEDQIDVIPGLDERNEKPMCERYFAPMNEGSLRSSIFSLSILSIGVGCLALPQRFGQLSVAFATFLIIVGCVSTYWTLDIIIIAGRKKKLSVYSLVIKEYCGSAWATVFDITLMVYVLGVMIAYQIISKILYNI